MYIVDKATHYYELSESVWNLHRLSSIFVVWGILLWIMVVGGAFASRWYIQRRGKNLGLDWQKLYHWRMAGLLFGPVVSVLFYFYTLRYRSKQASKGR